MPEPVVQHTLTGEQFDVFKDQIERTQKFLRNEFDLTLTRRAQFIMNLLTVECIDLHHDGQDPTEYIRSRVEAFAKCLTINFNSYKGTNVSISVRSQNA